MPPDSIRGIVTFSLEKAKTKVNIMPPDFIRGILTFFSLFHNLPVFGQVVEKWLGGEVCPCMVDFSAITVDNI